MEIYQPSFFDEADRLAKLTKLKETPRYHFQ